jgi:hypothetical protein
VTLYFFWFDQHLNSGLCTCKAGTLPFEPHLQVHLFCSGYFGDGVLRTTCPNWPRTSFLQIQPPK